MNEESMISIGNKHCVSFETNEIISGHMDNSQSKVKVEPRIMKVLQILMDNSPNVVPREKLIEEVWDNYGGADEALNQSISHLRKILDDNDKENRIIKTIVKKGYSFNGELSTINHKEKKSARYFKKSYFKILVLIILCMLLFWLYKSNTERPYVPKAMKSDRSKDSSESMAPKVQ